MYPPGIKKDKVNPLKNLLKDSFKTSFNEKKKDVKEE